MNHNLWFIIISLICTLVSVFALRNTKINNLCRFLFLLKCVSLLLAPYITGGKDINDFVCIPSLRKFISPGLHILIMTWSKSVCYKWYDDIKEIIQLFFFLWKRVVDIPVSHFVLFFSVHCIIYILLICILIYITFYKSYALL